MNHQEKTQSWNYACKYRYPRLLQSHITPVRRLLRLLNSSIEHLVWRKTMAEYSGVVMGAETPSELAERLSQELSAPEIVEDLTWLQKFLATK